MPWSNCCHVLSLPQRIKAEKAEITRFFQKPKTPQAPKVSTTSALSTADSVCVCEPGAGFFCCSPLYFQIYFISNYVNLSSFTFFETISWDPSPNYLDWLELICGWHQGPKYREDQGAGELGGLMPTFPPASSPHCPLSCLLS